MNFEFSDQLTKFRKEIREFLDENLTDAVRESPNGHHWYIDTPARQEFASKVADRGWTGMGWPEEYGGDGIEDPIARFLLNHELHSAGAPNLAHGLGVVANTLMRHGSPEQKAKFLPEILNYNYEWALCYTEPDAGSDLASLVCKAELVGDHFVVNGSKRFITGAHFGAYFWTAVRTDFDCPKHQGISLLIIPADLPGITVSEMWTVSGERTNEVWFDDVHVPKDLLVGEANRGWYYMCEALDYERVTLTSFAAGIGPLFKTLLGWLQEVEIGDYRPSEDPGVVERLGIIAADVLVNEMLQVKAIASATLDYVPNVEAGMIKYWSSRLEGELSNFALDVMGPLGYVWRGEDAAEGGELTNRYLAAGHQAATAGGVDISRQIIAKRGLGLPQS